MDTPTYFSPTILPSCQPNLIQALQGLLDSGDDSDVTFKVKDVEIKAHKLILRTRSPRFKEMFKSLPPNGSPPPINDFTPDDFKCFLTFLYTDDCYLSIKNVEEIFKLAQQWDVRTLIQKCMVFMENQIDESTILRYAKLAFSYGRSDKRCNLYKKCVSMIPEMLPDINFMINENSKWIPISYDLLFDIIKKCNYNPELEETLFYKIIDWAKKVCLHRHLDPTPDNIKLVMDEIPAYINYEMLYPRTLATLVHEYQLLSDEELLDCFCRLAIVEEKENEEDAEEEEEENEEDEEDEENVQVEIAADV